MPVISLEPRRKPSQRTANTSPKIALLFSIEPSWPEKFFLFPAGLQLKEKKRCGR